MVRAYLHLSTPFTENQGRRLTPLGRVTQRIDTGRHLTELLMSGGVLTTTGTQKALHHETTMLARDIIGRLFLGKEGETLLFSDEELMFAFQQNLSSTALSTLEPYLINFLTEKRSVTAADAGEGGPEDLSESKFSAEGIAEVNSIIFSTNRVLTKLGLDEVARLKKVLDDKDPIMLAYDRIKDNSPDEHVLWKLVRAFKECCPMKSQHLAFRNKMLNEVTVHKSTSTADMLGVLSEFQRYTGEVDSVNSALGLE
jgi:hypothetical protein